MLRMLRSMAFAALALTCALSAGWAQTPPFRLGGAVDASQAERTITIGPDTPWANVRQGESIRFVSGQNGFVWKFDGSAHSFDLTQVAPPGFLNRPVVVYVTPSANGRRAN